MARHQSPPNDILEAFPGAELVYKRRGEWAGPCPVCGGDDRLVIWEDGGSYCRHCDKYRNWRQQELTAENLLQLQAERARRKHDTEYEPYSWEVARFYHEQLMNDEMMLLWLDTKYSIGREVIGAALIGYDVLPRSRDKTNKRLLVPVPNEDGGAVKGFKGRTGPNTKRIKYNARLDRNKQSDEEGKVEAPRWTASAGTTSTLYGRETIQTGKPLLHCGEGEFKALAARTQGYAATTSTSGAATFEREWAEYIASVGPSAIYLIYDGDDAGRKGAAKAKRMLVRYAAGIPLYVVVLPEGKDFNDVLEGKKDKAGIVTKLLAAARVDVVEQQEHKPVELPPARRRVTRIKREEPVAPAQGQSLEEIRDGMRVAFIEFLGRQAEPGAEPAALLLAPYPGSGKTTELVGMIESLDVRVFYAVPRRNMWGTILEASADAALHGTSSESRASEWTNLRSRSAGDEYGPANCHWPEAVKEAQSKRRNVFDLICNGHACGMWGDCDYSQQFRNLGKFVLGRHNHVIKGGMAEKAEVIVLDENCVKSFIDQVSVPMEQLQINPASGAAAHKLVKVIALVVNATAFGGVPLYGPALVPLLDAEAREMCGEGLYSLLAGIDREDVALFGEPAITPSEVKDLPMKWFPEFYDILVHEATQWMNGAEQWNSRLVVDARQLHYTIIHQAKIGDKPVIIADATGSPELYAKLLRRPIEVYKPKPEQKAEVWQLTTRANGIGQLSAVDGRAWLDMAALLRFFTDQQPNTLIMAYKSLQERIQALQLPTGVQLAHYGGVVGSNEWKDQEQVILAGCYMPPRDAMIRKARALWWDDPLPIGDEWETVDTAYEVTDEVAFYPVSRFKDKRAELILEQDREAEMLQAFERIRTLIGEQRKRVIILSNIPIPGVQVTRLFDVKDADILGAPETLHRIEMRAYIERQITEAGRVLFNELADYFAAKGWSKPTIVKHRNEVILAMGLEIAALAPQPGQRGRPPKVASPAITITA